MSRLGCHNDDCRYREADICMMRDNVRITQDGVCKVYEDLSRVKCSNIGCGYRDSKFGCCVLNQVIIGNNGSCTEFVDCDQN